MKENNISEKYTFTPYHTTPKKLKKLLMMYISSSSKLTFNDVFKYAYTNGYHYQFMAIDVLLIGSKVYTDIPDTVYQAYVQQNIYFVK